MIWIVIFAYSHHFFSDTPNFCHERCRDSSPPWRWPCLDCFRDHFSQAVVSAPRSIACSLAINRGIQRRKEVYEVLAVCWVWNNFAGNFDHGIFPMIALTCIDITNHIPWISRLAVDWLSITHCYPLANSHSHRKWTIPSPLTWRHGFMVIFQRAAM